MKKKIGQQLDNLEEKWSKPGHFFHKIWPIFEAQDTGLRSPNTQAKSQGVHVRDAVNLKRMMVTVILALLPCLLFGIYNTGYQRLSALGLPTDFMSAFMEGLIAVLPIVIVSYAVGALWEVVFSIIRKHEINEGFLVTGMLFALVLPPTTPLWMVALGVSFGIVIGKEVFGGTGMNIVNPALAARAFLFFAYPAQLSGDKVWTVVDTAKEKVVDSFSGATALGIALNSFNKDDVVQNLENAGFDLWSMFIGLVPGSIGETSVLLCLLGAFILLVTGVASWRTMLFTLIGAIFVSLIVNAIASPDSAGLLGLPIIYQLCSGGFAFGLVFMATDPVSSSNTKTGQMIYGFLVGSLAITIRTLNPAYPEGMMLAILFMNIFAPLIDHYVVQANVRWRIKNV